MSSHVYHLVLLYMKIRFRERKSVARVKYFDYTDVAKPLFYKRRRTIQHAKQVDDRKCDKSIADFYRPFDFKRHAAADV